MSEGQVATGAKIIPLKVNDGGREARREALMRALDQAAREAAALGDELTCYLVSSAADVLEARLTR